MGGDLWPEGSDDLRPGPVRPAPDGGGGPSDGAGYSGPGLCGAGPEGLTIQEFSSGETAYDGDSRLLRKPAQAVCTAYLYAITRADGTFLDFEIRGEIIP